MEVKEDGSREGEKEGIPPAQHPLLSPSLPTEWAKCTTIVGNKCRGSPWASKYKRYGGSGLSKPLLAERRSGFCRPSFFHYQITLPNPIFILNIHNLLNKQRFLLQLGIITVVLFYSNKQIKEHNSNNISYIIPKFLKI